MRVIKWIFAAIIITHSAWAYRLVIIQGISKEKQTFVTRGGKNLGIFEGKNHTFTTDNVSVIAKAITVSREFTQWEIKNDFADVPFRRGERVVMYDTTEHIWALSPAEVQRKLIKTNIFRVKHSFEGHFSFARALSESTSQAIPQNLNRGGYQFDGMYRREFNFNYAYALGLRYSREVLNAPEASFINQRFLGIVEGRYYFDPIGDFYNARIGLTLGFGYGQSRTTTAGQASFGNVVLIPSTKISATFSLDHKKEIDFVGAFESLRIDESFADGFDQTTNLTNSKFGIIYRIHLDQ